jgi:hypothetical protein
MFITLTPGAGLALPGTTAVFRVSTGTRVEVRPCRAARGLLDSRSGYHVVRLSLLDKKGF